MSKPKKAHLLTGSNLGDRAATLQAAKQLIAERVGTIVKASALYETEPWGNVDQPDYLNQALEVTTELSPTDLLTALHQIEADLGRNRRNKWEPRPIDIDILFYDAKILKTNDLKIPHPHIARRNFVLIPLMEIAPLKKHPELHLTIEELYDASEDTLQVFLFEPA